MPASLQAAKKKVLEREGIVPSAASAGYTPATHTRSCPALTPGGEDDCTCGLEWRVKYNTAMILLAAWQKRAYEAEAELAKIKRV